jgi:hypothetical protein
VVWAGSGLLGPSWWAALLGFDVGCCGPGKLLLFFSILYFYFLVSILWFEFKLNFVLLCRF